MHESPGLNPDMFGEIRLLELFYHRSEGEKLDDDF